MSQQPQNRQELYDRIRASSKDEVILQEMIRLGFWPAAGVLPVDPADEIRRRGQLEAELRALRTEKSRLSDVEAMKREVRKRRLAESRKKREETKQKRLEQRAQRARAWAQQQSQQVVYVGKGVSAGLNQLTSDVDKLQHNGLPHFDTPAQLAQGMGIKVSELRFLAFHRSTARVTHYVQFSIPKRSGGQRLISAPRPRLKAAQQWILHHILDKMLVHERAHGFVHGRSIVTNALPHVGHDVVINVDLKDFFPSIAYPRVKGLFRSLGYSEAVATILGLICTEPQRITTELDGTTYHVALDKPVLPQGAPSSPAITNLLCRGLDARLTRVAATLGMSYTRYADDLSFSGAADANVGRLLRQLHYIVAAEGFTIHPEKTRVLRRGRRQEVTGIVVNDKVAIARSTLKRFRATLHQIETDGPAGKHWGQSDDVIAAVDSFAAYVVMVDHDKGLPLLARTRALVKKYGKKPQRQPSRKPPRVATPADPVQVNVDMPNRTQTTTSSPDKGHDGSNTAETKKRAWWKLW